jgi:hypothetical protein
MSAVLVMASLVVLQPQAGYAQKKEKVKKDRADSSSMGKHSPHKATLWALLPGAGQVYNKKYWKLPIVYAGFAVTGYFVISNRQEYLKYRNAYACSVQDDQDENFTCEDPLAERYSSTDLQTIRDYYRRNLELSFIFMGLWYVLQILDATVDAHLFHWDVNEDLNVRLDPIIQPRPQTIPLPNQPAGYNGLKVSFKF